MSKKILGFTGLIASGKDVTKKYIEEKYGASSHRFSTMLRDILTRLYLPITRENLQSLSLDLRTRFGGDTLARVIAQDVLNDKSEIIIIEGIRRADDIRELRNFPGFHLISIDAEAKTRYDRVIKRNENIGDADKTFEQFLFEGQQETELEIPKLIAESTYHLDNNGSLEDLYKQIDVIIKKL